MSLIQTADTHTHTHTHSPDLKLHLHPLSGPEAPLISPFREHGAEGGGGDRGWKGTGKQMASYLSLLCEGCHSNRLMQGLRKEKKRQRQSRKGLGEDNRATCHWADLSFGDTIGDHFSIDKANCCGQHVLLSHVSNDLMRCLLMIQPMV